MFKTIPTLSQETRTPIDTDGDGTPDRFEVDTDGDGTIDRIEFDRDNNGNIEQIVHLDDDGRWGRVDRDVDEDGNIDRITHYAFDDDGNRRVTQREFDDDDDGNIDRSEAYIYNDVTGNRTRIDFDLDNDGLIDRTAHLHANGRWERVEWDDDDDGTIDRTVHRNTDGSNTINRIDFDDDGDGTTDRSEFYTQNEDGNRDRTNFDDDADDTIDRSATYTYDAKSNRTRADFDDDNDGTTDRSETYTHDVNGNLSQTDFDDDADGNIDQINHHTYDMNSNRVQTNVDADADGIADRSESYTYDESGNRNRTSFDDDNDGTTDRSETYTYYTNGRVSQTRFDDDDDGTTDRSETYTYYANGRVSQTDFDDDDDGTIDRSETYAYYGNGRVSQTSFDDDDDGTTDRSETYTYYANGRVSQTRFDDNVDGTTDRSEFYTYNLDGRVSQTDFDDDADGTIDRSERALSSLDGSNGFILTGIDAVDTSGWSVSSAGDVNGDGYDDLIIGAIYADPNGEREAGETYIVYGGASVPGTDGELDLGALGDNNGFILAGIDSGDYSGASVSSAGDVNGDGYDDLIIGAIGVGSVQGEYDTILGPGEAYVVYGGATGADLVLDRSTLDGTNGFTLTGIANGGGLGQSVSSAGDVNGDGYDDLIIGAWGADPNGDSSAGGAYVVYGGASAPGTGGVLDLGALDGTNGFILNGIDVGDRSGRSVSSAGDVNGDGYDDLIIGAHGADLNGNTNAGETYVVYGGASAPGTDGVLDLSDLDGTNGFILTGIDAFDYSGSSVSSAGDVNGDGYDDLIIGARLADPNGDNSGEIYVVYGGASAPGTDGVLDLSMLNGTNGFILTGIDAGDLSGRSVSSAGDVNGDGYDDLIIGARGGDPNGDGSGETYIVYGGASAPGTKGVLDLGALNGTNGFILNGIDAYDQSGFSVSSAGDVNGDGYDDLIIGAWGADPNGGSEAGETYVIYGGTTESTAPVTASGTAAADNFTGNAGDDSFTAIATNDVVRGGAGDDIISVTALDFAAIDGGTGVDTLVLDGAGLALDLTDPGNAGMDSVELFDLSGTGANSLVLDALAVFDVTEEREGGMASLDVLGDADDRVDLSGSSFALNGTATEDGVTYNVYRDGNAEVRIEDGVMVTLAATGSQSARFKTDAKIDTKTDTGIDPVADPRTDPGTDPESGTRLDEALMNSDSLMNNDPWNNNLWNNDLWDGLWADGVMSLDQPVHIDEDAILIPLSDPLSFGPLASGPLPGPWGDLIYWPGLGSHPAMQNDLAMILPEMEIVTADMEGF